MKRLATLALLLATLPAWGANVTATTGWLTKDGTTPLAGDLTIDAGADWFIIYNIDRQLTSSIPPCTLDGVDPTHAIDFDTGASDRHNHFLWMWNAAAIANMTGAATVSGCSLSSTDTYYLYGAIENTSSTTFAAFTGTAEDIAGDPTIATCTHTTGDLVVAGVIDKSDASTITSWESLSELEDVIGDASIGGFAAGNNAGDGSITVDITAPTGASGACVVFVDAAAAAPTWDTEANVQSQDDAEFTVQYDADANATAIFGAAFPIGTAEQTGAAIEAGTGAHGTATEATTGSSDTIVLTPTDSPPFPAYELQWVLKGAGGYSTVVSLPLEFLDPPAGKQFMTLASVDAGSHCAGQTPTIVAGDITVYDTVTNTTGYTITDFDTCLISIAGGGDPNRQTYELNVYDASLAAYYGEATFATNNGVPFTPGEWPLADALYQIAVNPAFDPSLSVEDPEDDDLTWTYSAGTQPTDWSLNADTGAITGGIPGACGPSTFTLRATDIFFDFIDLGSVVNIGPLVPAFTGDDGATYDAEVEATGQAEGCTLTATEGTSVYSATVPVGDVVSVDPAVGTLVELDAEVTYFLSRGPAEGIRRKLNLGLDLGISDLFEVLNAANDEFWELPLAA